MSFRGAKYWYTYELSLLRPKKARLKMNSGKHEKILGTGSRFPCFNYRNHYRIPFAELTNVLGVSRKDATTASWKQKSVKTCKNSKNKYRDYLRKTQKGRKHGSFIAQIPVGNCNKFCQDAAFVNFVIFELIFTKDMLKKARIIVFVKKYQKVSPTGICNKTTVFW